MAEFRAATARPAIDTVVQKDAHPDTRINGHDDKIGNVMCVAKVMFGHGNQIGVIVQKYGQAELFG